MPCSYTNPNRHNDTNRIGVKVKLLNKTNQILHNCYLPLSSCPSPRLCSQMDELKFLPTRVRRAATPSGEAGAVGGGGGGRSVSPCVLGVPPAKFPWVQKTLWVARDEEISGFIAPVLGTLARRRTHPCPHQYLNQSKQYSGGTKPQLRLERA